jgi:hypothetical protein
MSDERAYKKAIEDVRRVPAEYKKLPTSLSRVCRALRVFDSMGAAPADEAESQRAYARKLNAAWTSKPEKYGGPVNLPADFCRIPEGIASEAEVESQAPARRRERLCYYHLEAYARYTRIPIGVLVLMSRLVNLHRYVGDELPNADVTPKAQDIIDGLSAMIAAYQEKIADLPEIDESHIRLLIESYYGGSGTTPHSKEPKASKKIT